MCGMGGMGGISCPCAPGSRLGGVSFFAYGLLLWPVPSLSSEDLKALACRAKITLINEQWLIAIRYNYKIVFTCKNY